MTLIYLFLIYNEVIFVHIVILTIVAWPEQYTCYLFYLLNGCLSQHNSMCFRKTRIHDRTVTITHRKNIDTLAKYMLQCIIAIKVYSVIRPSSMFFHFQLFCPVSSPSFLCILFKSIFLFKHIFIRKYLQIQGWHTYIIHILKAKLNYLIDDIDCRSVSTNISFSLTQAPVNMYVWIVFNICKDVHLHLHFLAI